MRQSHVYASERGSTLFSNSCVEMYEKINTLSVWSGSFFMRTLLRKIMSTQIVSLKKFVRGEYIRRAKRMQKYVSFETKRNVSCGWQVKLTQQRSEYFLFPLKCTIRSFHSHKYLQREAENLTHWIKNFKCSFRFVLLEILKSWKI